MSALILAVLVIFVLGVFGGLTGIGGVLMIPAIIEILKMDTHLATSTIYASFVFSGLFSAWLYSRKGQFQWGIAMPLCVGGSVCSYLGALLKAHVSGYIIIMTLACMILLAGLNALRPPREGVLNLGAAPFKTRCIFLFCLGCVVGFLGGLAGSGGAVLIVPIMLACGFPVALTVSGSLLFSVPSGIAGSIANIMNGYIAYTALLWISAFQVAGCALGVYLSGRVPLERVKLIIAFMCIGAGFFIILRNF